MPKKRVKVHYRRLRREKANFPDMSLSSAIVAALGVELPDGTKIKRVTNRIAGVPGSDGSQRVLNHFAVGGTYAFGTVCLFSPGQLQALLQLKDEGPREEISEEVLAAWDIEERAAPTGNEYLHGITYWFATGDHFYQIQHAALQAKAMEEYFTWLLRDRTSTIGPESFVELQVEFDRAQISEDNLDVTSIEVGGLVPETVRAPTEDPRRQVHDVEVREGLADRLKASFFAARKILDDLLGPVKAQEIIDSMPADAALDVTVNIGYRSTKRKLTREFMKNLASGLRNIPDGELRVRGRDGDIKGDDARLSLDMNVEKLRENSSLLDLGDALAQMVEVHRRFIHDGKVIQ